MGYTIFDKVRGGKALTSMAIGSVVVAALLLSVSVVAAQGRDFSIGSSPSSLCVNPGINAKTVVFVSSDGGFVGTVNLSGQTSPASGVALSGIPSSVSLSIGQTVTFDLNMYTTPSTSLYTYTITITGISGIIVHQATITLMVSSDCSVGGVIVSTAHATIGSTLLTGIAIAGLVGVVATGLAVYVSRSKNRARA